MYWLFWKIFGFVCEGIRLMLIFIWCCIFVMWVCIFEMILLFFDVWEFLVVFDGVWLFFLIGWIFILFFNFLRFFFKERRLLLLFFNYCLYCLRFLVWNFILVFKVCSFLIRGCEVFSRFLIVWVRVLMFWWNFFWERYVLLVWVMILFFIFFSL